jgi:cobalt/nickel transport system ATP-binding protein
MGNKTIILDNVSKKYGDRTLFHDFSYTFNKLDRIGIIGPNGCGKSTLFRVLNGLSFPTKGHFIFDGTVIDERYLKDEQNARDFHRRIGYVFQDSEVQLFTRSVEDEIAFGLFQLGLDEKEVEERVEYYLKLLEIEELRYRAPFNLSGGEKKRVALAAIFAMKPEVLILDEPLAGLDEEGQKFITDFIIKQKSTDKLIIISTHNRELAEAVSDVVVHMDKNHKFVL